MKTDAEDGAIKDDGAIDLSNRNDGGGNDDDDDDDDDGYIPVTNDDDDYDYDGIDDAIAVTEQK